MIALKKGTVSRHSQCSLKARQVGQTFVGKSWGFTGLVLQRSVDITVDRSIGNMQVGHFDEGLVTRHRMVKREDARNGRIAGLLVPISPIDPIRCDGGQAA